MHEFCLNVVAKNKENDIFSWKCCTYKFQKMGCSSCVKKELYIAILKGSRGIGKLSNKRGLFLRYLGIENFSTLVNFSKHHSKKSDRCKWSSVVADLQKVNFLLRKSKLEFGWEL